MSEQDAPREFKESGRRETWCGLTMMYLFLEIGRPKKDGPENAAIRKELCE
jgi:hypothetical protein